MVIRQLDVKSSAVPTNSGLRDMAKVELEPQRRQMLELADRSSGGDAAWRGRKRREAFDLLALSQIAPDRLVVRFLDMHEALRALLVLNVPVACRPDANNQLHLADYAVLGFTYPAEALRQRLPGFAFLQILDPHNVWHPNVDSGIQRLCLGATLPAGVPAKELVLSAFGALSMQTVQVNETDPAGVLNIEAARWWQQNLHRTPLTREPFINRDRTQHTLRSQLPAQPREGGNAGGPAPTEPRADAITSGGATS